MQRAPDGDTVAGVQLPPPLDDLPTAEAVFRAAPVRIAASPGAHGGLRGVAVLTSERLIVVPGATDPRARRGDPIQQALASLWEMVKPALLEAFPVARLLARPHAILAARARPGIEIPLEMIRRAFEARLPGWIGIELALPPPDPRPPFALYFELDASAGAPREWVERIEGQKHEAPARPELERPYALFYLLRPLPRPVVVVHGRQGRRRGSFVLHADGPAIATRWDETVLLAYESITGVAWAAPTPWRSASLRIEAGDHVFTVAPRDDWSARLLHDSAHLLAEVAGVPLRTEVGAWRTSRVVTALLTVAGTAAAVAWQVLHSLP